MNKYQKSFLIFPIICFTGCNSLFSSQKVAIHYFIDGNEKKTMFVTKGTKLKHLDWISDDYIYGCNKWFSDETMVSEIDKNFAVDDEITLYGQKQLILEYSTTDGIDYCHVNKCNFVPSTGEIVIPKTFLGKTVRTIQTSAFSWRGERLRVVYIPIINEIYPLSFYACFDLETIYFEGSRSEWDEINKETFDEKVEIIFNTYLN